MRKAICILFLLCPLLLTGQGYHKSILKKIKEGAVATHSDAVLIYQNGKLIYQYHNREKEKPMYIASAGKSLVSMAIGKLLDDGKLDSLDQPIYTLFPEWKQGQKKQITVRMLLNHTSGLQDYRNASKEIEPAPDYKNENIIKMALAAELQTPPGQNIFYSNKATALLGGVIEKASGQPFDQYFKENFYDPLEISEFDWIRDKAGNATTHGAFIIKPSDFLKFGIVMLHNGLYNNKRILSEKWVKQSVEPGQNLDPIWGLLWWRIPEKVSYSIDDEIITEWEKASVSQEFIASIRPIRNQVFTSKESFKEAMESLSGKPISTILNKELPEYVRYRKRIFSGKMIGYSAEGFRGNYLVIIPEAKIVAVRVADQEGFNYETDTFGEFVDLIANLGKQRGS